MTAEKKELKVFPAGLRVLVVDDDPLCLRIVEKMLKRCQYEGARANARDFTPHLPFRAARCLVARRPERSRERARRREARRPHRAAYLDAAARAFSATCPPGARPASVSVRPTRAATHRIRLGPLTHFSSSLLSPLHSHDVLARRGGSRDPARAQGRLRHRPQRRAHAGHGRIQTPGAHRARARRPRHECVPYTGPHTTPSAW